MGYFDVHPLAFSHRGGRALWPENTLCSFQHSYDLGFRYFETDLHLSKDGVLVIFHDDYLDRTTDGTGFVWEYTVDELKRFDAGFRFGARRGWPYRGQGVVIPTLEEVFDALPDTYWTLELKQGGLEQPLTEFLDRYDLWDRVIVGGFDDRWMARLRRVASRRVMTSAGKWEARLFWAASRLGVGPVTPATALQVPPEFGGRTIVDARFLTAARRAEKYVHVWTINEAAEMHRLLDLGVDGIMSDRPDVLKEVFTERGLWHG